SYRRTPLGAAVLFSLPANRVTSAFTPITGRRAAGPVGYGPNHPSPRLCYAAGQHHAVPVVSARCGGQLRP
nr:hypothetical protein [Tanacetum cinerariifolium]